MIDPTSLDRIRECKLTGESLAELFQQLAGMINVTGAERQSLTLDWATEESTGLVPSITFNLVRTANNEPETDTSAEHE